MSGRIYRYFRIYEREISQIIEACKESLREYRQRSEELTSKYGIHKFMIYRNATRSERACKRGIDDPAEHMDVLVLFTKTDTDKQTETEIKSDPEKAEALKAKLKKTQRSRHPGFTSVSGSTGSGDNFMLYKIDLRKREGKDIFKEFMDLYALNPEDTKPYQYIADCFGLQCSLVPNIPAKTKSKFSYYETFEDRFGQGAGAYWLFAVPVYSQRYARAAGQDSSRPTGLKDSFVPAPPAEEIEREEYLELWTKGPNNE